MQSAYGNNAFVGEVHYPQIVLETSSSIRFDLQHLQGKQLDAGIVYLSTEAEQLYPAVLRAIQYPSRDDSSSSPVIQADQETLSVTVEGITFTQAQQARRLYQKQEPRLLAFCGEVIDHFSLPVITQGRVGIRIRPLRYDTLSGWAGSLKIRDAIDLVSLSGNHYTATIHSASRPYFDVSRPGELWTQDLSVEGITFEEVQDIRWIMQMGGLHRTAALGAISAFQPMQRDRVGIELRVHMLQKGLMRKSGGEAYLISQSGEMWPIVIQHLTFLPSPRADSLHQNKYSMIIENIPLKLVEEAQSIIQWPPPLEIDPAIPSI